MATSCTGKNFCCGNDEYLTGFTQIINKYQITQNGDLFWSIYYYYTTNFYYNLAGSGATEVRKLRFYKNGTFLEEIDVSSNGDEADYKYYLGENDQILHTEYDYPTNAGDSILDSSNTVLATPIDNIYYSIVNLIYLPAKEATEEEPAIEAEYIIAVVDDIQGEGVFFGLYRYDSEWNLIESRNIWATDLGALASNSYGANPNNYWAKNGDTILQGCQPLITNPMFKCIGGFRSVKQDYLFSGYDKAWSYGEPWRYLGFAQSVLPWF